MFLGIIILGEGNDRIKLLCDWSVFGGQNKCEANKINSFYAISLVCVFIDLFPEILIHHRFPVNEMISRDDTGCDKVGRTHYFEVAGQKIEERVDITLEKLSAHLKSVVFSFYLCFYHYAIQELKFPI